MYIIRINWKRKQAMNPNVKVIVGKNELIDVKTRFDLRFKDRRSVNKKWY